jgi:hypothetical protein
VEVERSLQILERIKFIIDVQFFFSLNVWAMKKITLIIALLGFATGSVFAHSGGTDSNGGHYNRKTGQYHQH